MRQNLVLLVTLCLLASVSSTLTDNSLTQEWELYKTSFNKTYKDKNEESLRRIIWEDNVQFINHHNMAADRGEHSYWLGLSHITDLREEEILEMMTGNVMDDNITSASTFLPPNYVFLPSQVDWRNKGYVTPVKNQGSCGSCWAFSTVGSLEGQHFKKTGKLVPLSEQNLVDCDKSNKGCRGGNIQIAFQYIKNNKGLDTERSYPYTGKDGSCKFKSSAIGATVTGTRMISKGNEAALQTAVATVGPISVAIFVNKNFMHYKSGVFDDVTCRSTTLNHGVLVVGYGVQSGRYYWLVKNSWGASWGMKGYIMMARNKGNQCGIASLALYPLV